MEKAKEIKSELKFDTSTKIVNAKVKGFFAPEDAEYFVSEYMKLIKQIDAKEYELQFDCTELRVSAQDMVPVLKGCFDMYKKDGFKKIIFDCGEHNAPLKMQAKRVARMAELENYEVI
jgi:hypothetical protein